MVGSAENVSGLSRVPKTRASRLRGAVGEHSYCAEAVPVRDGGVIRRENVGMSNHNPDEKSGPRKPKVSVAMAIIHGLGGPKAMAKAAVDGQSVNIPTLKCFCDGGTGNINLIVLMA